VHWSISVVIVTGSETSHWRPVPNAIVCLLQEVVVDVQSYVKVPLGSAGAGAGVAGEEGPVSLPHRVVARTPLNVPVRLKEVPSPDREKVTSPTPAS